MFFNAQQYYSAIRREHRNYGIYVAAYHRKYSPNGWGGYVYDTRTLTQKETREALRAIKQQIRDRRKRLINNNGQAEDLYITKFLRPWDVVPELKNYSAPAGDFGVGVEIEMGFVSEVAAQQVAKHIANWKYVCLDFEGGVDGIEATFPPASYSTFGQRSQACRYLNYLQQNQSLVQPHQEQSMVGTHVNVSKSGVRTYHRGRADILNYTLERMCLADKHKYFGRDPYGGVFVQAGYLEFKLFNSTLDSKVLMRYVDIAVALTALLTSNRDLTMDSVYEACETGYNKRAKKQPVAATKVSSVPLAA